MSRTLRVGAGAYAELDGTPRAPGEARALVRDFLGEHPSADDAALVISELTGNSVTHSRSGQPGGTVRIGVEMAPRHGDVHIKVADAGSGDAPAVTQADRDSEHGRGMAIVDALAAEWGSHGEPSGRVTWCRLKPSRHAETRRDRVAEREAG